MLQRALEKVIENQSLSELEAGLAMDTIMDGKATNAQIAALLTSLRMKGETLDEIAGFARSMRNKAVTIRCQESPSELIDTCGTGGDCLNTFNISTAAAFVAAGAGIRIAKHGNRAMSSKCGSADILEALGVNINLTPDQVSKCMDQVGIGFLFAQKLHPAMRYAAPVRKELGVRTIFNLLGPLTNPADAKGQVMGIFDPDLTEMVAGVLCKLGSERALVLHGMDGMDEITTCASTKISELRDGKITTYEIHPSEFGIALASPKDLKGGNPEENARNLEALLKGEKGPLRDIVLLNSAAAMVVGKKADSLLEGFKVAVQSLDSGKAFEKLIALRELSHDS